MRGVRKNELDGSNNKSNIGKYASDNEYMSVSNLS